MHTGLLHVNRAHATLRAVQVKDASRKSASNKASRRRSNIASWVDASNFLLAAMFFIRSKNIAAHKASVLTAFGFTTLFLLSYVVYHTFKPGPVAYEGSYRGLYLFILLSHIALAPVVVPAALLSLYRGWMDQRDKHRRLVRWTWPLWFYVAVTGVLVYIFLYL